jgi:hypothetical protein
MGCTAIYNQNCAHIAETALAEIEDTLDADGARGAPASVSEARLRVADAQVWNSGPALS